MRSIVLHLLCLFFGIDRGGGDSAKDTFLADFALYTCLSTQSAQVHHCLPLSKYTPSYVSWHRVFRYWWHPSTFRPPLSSHCIRSVSNHIESYHLILQGSLTAITAVTTCHNHRAASSVFSSGALWGASAIVATRRALFRRPKWTSWPSHCVLGSKGTLGGWSFKVTKNVKFAFSQCLLCAAAIHCHTISYPLVKQTAEALAGKSPERKSHPWHPLTDILQDRRPSSQGLWEGRPLTYRHLLHRATFFTRSTAHESGKSRWSRVNWRRQTVGKIMGSEVKQSNLKQSTFWRHSEGIPKVHQDQPRTQKWNRLAGDLLQTWACKLGLSKGYIGIH